jgi:two-component system, cell cycle sensor histidine kinase and response regulator CckA
MVSIDLLDHRARVLIVDDELLNRQLLEVMLMPEGLLLQTAKSGEEALAMVAEAPPDLILLDVMMPGLDGYQVAAKIKSNPATANIPVIMVTALDDRQSRMVGLSAGAEDFLAKPVDRVELCVRVRNLLRLKAYADYHDQYSHMLEAQVTSRTTDLQQERDRAQRYLDTAGVILLALDEAGRITLVNRYACSTLGWTAEELLGRDWMQTCVPARLWNVLQDKFRDLIRGDLPLHENPIVTRSGEERLIEWRNTVVRDDTGRITGSLSSGTDVTERTVAVEALRVAEERMRFALQNANVGIWDLDYATGAARWSEILESQFGLRPGTFGGTFQAFVDLVHPDDRKSVVETLTNAMRSGDDFSYAHRAIRADGSTRWLRGSGRMLLSEQGQPVRGLGIYQDVTERRMLEAQNEQLQKMEAVGRLAAGVAHDFNNLLTVILGLSDLLLADLGSDAPHRADIAEIHKAGTRGASLTKQLLAFSRKQIIEPTILDLNAVIAGMEVMLGRLIGEDVELVLALRPDVAPVSADRGQIEQVVMNLAVNARDAMPKGGTLTIAADNVELDEHYGNAHLAVKPGLYVRLTVTDTGTGMTPQVQARLFEPFFTTKELGKGTGLGMATVYGIVTRSGGSIGVYSELGSGTAFKVYFPRADATQMVVDSPAPVARPHAGTHTVMLVEDEEGLRELARRLLKRLGYTVIVAADASEALQLFEANPSIDILLTDVIMPGASGPELTRQLVEQRPALRVIYMSGYTEDAIARHGGIKPGTAFLNKPFTSEALGAKIRDVLEHDKPRPV